MKQRSHVRSNLKYRSLLFSLRTLAFLFILGGIFVGFRGYSYYDQRWRIGEPELPKEWESTEASLEAATKAQRGGHIDLATEYRNISKYSIPGDFKSFLHHTAMEAGSRAEDDPETPFEALRKCKTLECTSALHESLQLAGAKFNFPHFMIAGWQKSATTSIYRHLRLHPDVEIPKVKEPHFFTSCQRHRKACKVTGWRNETNYMEETFYLSHAAETSVSHAAFDASVDYAQNGETLAPRLRKLFPWLKLIFVFRERIGRSMSWKNMMQQKSGNGCRGEAVKCIKASIQKHLYYECMVHWFKHFPAEQIYVVQFEELTYSPDKTLKGLKLFLGLDPEKPKRELDQVNARPSSSGWKMNQSDYEGLVSIAKDDLLRLVNLLRHHKKPVDGWMERWESLWSRNLDTCDESNECTISSM